MGLQRHTVNRNTFIYIAYVYSVASWVCDVTTKQNFVELNICAMNLPPSLFTRQIDSNTDKDSHEFSALWLIL